LPFPLGIPCQELPGRQLDEAVSVHAEDDDKFIRLFSKSQCSLYAFILGLTHNTTDADDLLQELNLALWKKRHSYDPQFDFLRWAIGFARIEVKNHRKKFAKSRLLFSDDVLNSLADDWPNDVSFHEQRLAALASCLQKLSTVEYRFIADFYRRDLSVNKLAELHNTPASTVYKILSRARTSLQRCVQRTIAMSSYPA
jgi:RNA polymerase sigma-70 factor, ECF subfamily